MRTLLDIKKNEPFDAEIFEKMKKTAQDLLQRAEKGQYTQAIVLFSSKGNEYGTVIENALSSEKADESEFLLRVRQVEDTKILYLLCLWQDMNIDLPSFAFREMLREINPQNDETRIFVMTKNGISAVKLSNIRK